MSYYPSGAFQELMRIESDNEKFDLSLRRATAEWKEALKDASKNGSKLEWTNSLGEQRKSRPESFVTENMPDEVMNHAVAAWLAGDVKLAWKYFNAACQIGFEAGIDFLATVDAERNYLDESESE